MNHSERETLSSESLVDKPLGAKLFTLAAISDTHLNQGETECNSPFPVNQLANQRMRYVVQDLNRRDINLVINLGDLIHPVPAVPELYRAAVACFKEQVSELKAPLFCVPGNHDIGDKPNDWAPAGGICEAYIDLWTEHFGFQYQRIDRHECVFFLINAQLINSGLKDELEQKEWLETQLQDAIGKRIFLFSHYPPYFSHAQEDDNYDNISEPGRSWLLGLLELHRVEAIFAGHVHNFWFNKHQKTDCYLLPSTAFVRQDYSEMFRIAPTPEQEYGRNDLPKLGYFLVHIYEHGHVCELVRTYGQCQSKDELLDITVPISSVIHPKLNARCRFGFDMRHNWMEVVEIPPTGGLDEFDRKEVRNDYPLLALWEMGVRHVRVPLRDLKLDRNRQRLYDLHTHGMRFSLSSFGAPTAEEARLISANTAVLEDWEVGYNPDLIDLQALALGAILDTIKLPVYLSKLRSGSSMRAETGRYYHVINQGFYPDEKTEIKDLLSRYELRGKIAGVVFRVHTEHQLAEKKNSIWKQMEDIQEWTDDCHLRAHVHLRLMGNNPAQARWDETQTNQCLVEAMLACACMPKLTVFANTYEDNDRGYFVRQGVIDRLANPRPALRLVKQVNTVLQSHKRVSCLRHDINYWRLETDQGQIEIMFDEHQTELKINYI